MLSSKTEWCRDVLKLLKPAAAAAEVVREVGRDVASAELESLCRWGRVLRLRKKFSREVDRGFVTSDEFLVSTALFVVVDVVVSNVVVGIVFVAAVSNIVGVVVDLESEEAGLVA